MNWSWLAFAVVLVVGLIVIYVHRDWRLTSFGPVFYAAPLAAFGVEHFVFTKGIATGVPKWIPWHTFWVYLLGVCFIAAGFSLATRIATRLTASLLALTFFLFVALMDTPAWGLHPHDPFAMTLLLRQLAFSGGALALAATVENHFATVARIFIAVGVLVYAYQQFRRPDHVPAIPLRLVTPDYVIGHEIWTYLTGAVYVIAGVPLLVNWKSRQAATLIGLTILFVELVVYIPIAVVMHTEITGFNYLADTLMYCGAVLMLAGAMPVTSPAPAPSSS